MLRCIELTSFVLTKWEEKTNSRKNIFMCVCKSSSDIKRRLYLYQQKAFVWSKYLSGQCNRRNVKNETHECQIQLQWYSKQWHVAALIFNCLVIKICQNIYEMSTNLQKYVHIHTHTASTATSIFHFFRVFRITMCNQ